jgi:hypothetical protein
LPIIPTQPIAIVGKFHHRPPNGGRAFVPSVSTVSGCPSVRPLQIPSARFGVYPPSMRRCGRYSSR